MSVVKIMNESPPKWHKTVIYDKPYRILNWFTINISERQLISTILFQISVYQIYGTKTFNIFLPYSNFSLESPFVFLSSP